MKIVEEIFKISSIIMGILVIINFVFGFAPMDPMQIIIVYLIFYLIPESIKLIRGSENNG